MTKKESDVLKLIKKGESQTLEFKSSLSDVEKILHELCGFANTDGGILLVGVSDSGKLLGTDIGKNTIESFTNKISQGFDPKLYPKIEKIRLDNKDLLLVEIKDMTNKPYQVFGKAFKRVGKSSLQMSRDEFERMILEKHKDKVRFDSRICKDAKLEDIDEEKVKWFLKKASFERRLKIDSAVSGKEILKRLNLMKDSKLTNAAVLLFGKNPQRFFLQAETRCARFKGIEPLEFIDMKVLGGSIIEQREDSLGFVKEHIKLHAKVKGTERIEKWEYPIEALREAITNAICHRDYETSSNVQVRIFDDRIEVWGCGPLPPPLTVADLKKDHDSILRNPLIGKSFFLIKYIEQWGTGTNRIIRECLTNGLPEPVFEEITGSLVVTFRKSRLTEEFLKALGLNERQRKAVDYAKERGEINNATYRKINNIGKVTAARELNELVTKSVLKAIGRGRTTRYVLNE